MKDNFSRQAETYAKYRPGYPRELFDFILSHITARNEAWDCATGNGQSARELARYFKKVMATDISQNQIDRAAQAENIIYSIQPAEATSFPENSFDLITVSQALHWLQFEKFYQEVRRVGRQASWIAVWMYGLLHISPAIDKLIEEYHYSTLATYWDYERKYVDENYSTIPFPFEEISCPLFSIRLEWTLAELEGYLLSWSALQKFISANDFNPVEELMQKTGSLWSGKTMPINFPVHMRMGKIHK